MYPDHNFNQIDELILSSQRAYNQYKQISLSLRATLLRTIALALDQNATSLIQIAASETNLSIERLQSELVRTTYQLNNYAAAIEKGDLLEIRIDTAVESRFPRQPDLRKMMIPIGPVVIFGASNFPFAYSTAGGDTACALAAGCSVIVKAHPAHVETSTKVAELINQSLEKCNLPDDLFTHVYGANFQVGEYLVKHAEVKAVAFTGSLQGGRSLFNLASQRPNPIPVFAEMGSTNPVFLLPNQLAIDSANLAKQLMQSITQDMGQFCTKPGLIVGFKSDEFDAFSKLLNIEMQQAIPTKMLNQAIAANYLIKMQTAIMQRHVDTLYQSANLIQDANGMIALAKMTARYFLSNPQMHEEVFGPYSLLIECSNEEEMLKVAKSISGQLTCTLIADEIDISNNEQLVTVLSEKCGRFILNSIPTGVAVSLAMNHGGPYPACTDSRVTSVGADGIKRFLRPISYQNWANSLLPIALQNENPLLLWRTVNNELTQKAIEIS